MIHPIAQIAVVAADADAVPQARQTARLLDLPFINHPETSSADILLLVEKGKNSLQINEKKAPTVEIDFTTGKSAYRRRFGGGVRQAISRAVGLDKCRKLHVLDATGGLARDAFVLATLGARLTVIERSKILCYLIDIALRKAEMDTDTALIAQRMSIIHADSVEYIQRLRNSDQPDVIYLDPMYPIRHKSAATKKDMHLLHKLIGPENNASQLLQAALGKAKKRVVIKRPAAAPAVASRNLKGAISLTNTRFDIYSPISTSDSG